MLIGKTISSFKSTGPTNTTVGFSDGSGLDITVRQDGLFFTECEWPGPARPCDLRPPNSDDDKDHVQNPLPAWMTPPECPPAPLVWPEATRKHAHYFKRVDGLREIDIYRMLDLFAITDQAVGHAVKKLMCAGGRGAKTAQQDIQEAIDTLQRRLEMYKEDEACAR